MSQVIKISFELYSRLGTHAKGFETPADVIEKILNFYENHGGVEPSVSAEPRREYPIFPEIIYYPNNEKDFKQALLRTKVAYILLHKVDGTTELKEWNALNFRSDSSVNGNLRSGYLRGWKEKGIVKAEVSIDRRDFSTHQ